jgi:hypothetical protein
VIEFKNVSSLQLKKIIKTINFPAICLFGVVTGDKFLPMSLLALIIAGVNKLIIRCNGIDENPEQGLITGVNHTVDAIINRWCRWHLLTGKLIREKTWSRKSPVKLPLNDQIVMKICKKSIDPVTWNEVSFFGPISARDQKVTGMGIMDRSAINWAD